MSDINLDDVPDFTNEQSDIVLDEYIEVLTDFLETVYKKEMEFLAANYPEEKSLEIDYKKLEAFDLNIAERLLDTPQLIVEAANAAIKKIDIAVLDSSDFGDSSEFEPRIRFYNLPVDSRIEIRNIGSEHLSKLISVEGIIRQITERLEKMTVAHFICRRCQTSFNIIQKTQQITKPVMCSECKSRDFDIDLEQSKFIDYQKIQIQEPLENLKGSEQASNVDIYLSEDLVSRCVAGDRVVITGVVKLKPPKGDTNIYNKYVIANHVEKTEQEFDDLKVSPEEEREIKQLASRDDIYDLLSGSIAPNIYGHQIVKEAVMLQMFGGVKKKVANQDMRGNIHVLLVGDPGTGKSRILSYADTLAPKSVYVAGKTTSGAGLTVSAVKDDFGEGGWTLKAGAVILANGGMAMIDEFDKMSQEDSSALHEAMAQSTVSVSKAGLYSKFKSDTSILAAANPKFNRFDKYKNALEQINLLPSLISRFDLYFIIKDSLDRNLDLEMGKHIVQTHQAAEELTSSKKRGSLTKEELDKIEEKIIPKVDPQIFQKYVSYARQNVRPVLTKEASDKLLAYYVELRDMGRKENCFAATPRQLEGLIRLSEASAKIKLKQYIDIEDAQRAIRIFKTSLEQTAMDPETGKIDIDIISTGQSNSERNVVKKVLSFITTLTSEGNPVSMNDLVDFSEKEGVTKDKLRDSIIKLKKMGEIYEPKNGQFKPTFQE